MDALSAFAMGRANRGKEMKVFDWAKAATIIKEQNAQLASAGLSEDWDWTSGKIFENGKPVLKEETYTYLASTWATPELRIDEEAYPCFIMQSKTEWDAETYWPKEALDILAQEG